MTPILGIREGYARPQREASLAVLKVYQSSRSSQQIAVPLPVVRGWIDGQHSFEGISLSSLRENTVRLVRRFKTR
jgi:hypothetical protein